METPLNKIKTAPPLMGIEFETYQNKKRRQKLMYNKRKPIDNTSYINPDISIQTEYTIEYIDDPDIWKSFCNETHPAPWELYSKITTTSLQEAIEAFLSRYMNDRVFDVRIWEDTKIEGETVREVFVNEFRCVDWIRSEQQRELNDRNIKLQDTIEFAQKRIDLFEKYLGQFRDGMMAFNEFCDKQATE